MAHIYTANLPFPTMSCSLPRTGFFRRMCEWEPQRLGRPLTAGLHADEVRELYRAGRSKSAIARRLRIGRTSVRRMLSAKEQ